MIAVGDRHVDAFWASAVTFDAARSQASEIGDMLASSVPGSGEMSWRWNEPPEMGVAAQPDWGGEAAHHLANNAPTPWFANELD